MTRYLITLRSDEDRKRAVHMIGYAPQGTRIELKSVKRSTDQNSLMWAALTDIATQLEWHGKKLRPDDWKLLFLDALKRELRTMPSLDGQSFVNIGTRSSDLSREEMGDMITLIHQFGAEHGVKFGDEE